MSRWRQWVRAPEGALPGGIVTKAGIILIAVLVAGLVFSWSLTGSGGEAATGVALPELRAVDEGMGRALEGRIRAEAERRTQQAAAEEARAEFTRRQAAAAEEAPRTDAETPEGGTVVGSDAEAELREVLRLEEIERRTRSLRSLPLTRSYRDADEPRDWAAPAGGGAPDPGAESIEAALDGTLNSFERSLAALEEEIEAGLGGERLPPGAPTPAPGRAARVPDTREPTALVHPSDPPGWERIHEGSFLEAVLLTQLSGEFPGPVLAMVSVPLYSADRQRVLIPRGARVVGTARAVQDRNQSRLAVAFHRLILPGGSWVDIEFAGLNQAGEGALRDQVNRHYLSTFAAAGAVGVLSGLTLAGASPYGLRAGIGQGIGQSATSLLDRYLNRLPEITIRAGHRLRVWLTADVLIPLPAAAR